VAPKTAKKSARQYEGPASSGATEVVRIRLDGQDYDIAPDHLAERSSAGFLRKPRKPNKPNFFLRILHKFI